MSSNEGFKPEVFNTHAPKLKAHFERYNGEAGHEGHESEFDDIREEIARYYGVPFTEDDDERGKNHIFIIENSLVKNQRHVRAFCVIQRKEGDKEEAWYIDGRMPHVTMLQRLYNYYHVPDDGFNVKTLGFLDDEGFPEIEAIQKKSQEIGKPITWFVRETTSKTPPDKEHSIG